ncbi:MAG: hypothetical protein H0U73_05260 [Tatlockia sp.]|nr:hypothetical protein [Tatlockia sp.]
MLSKKEVFNAEVVKFKATQGKKLKNFLDEKQHPETTQAFFANPVIREYLSREADRIDFFENHPVLSDATTKEDKQKSDHYELKIYKLLPNVMMYRNAFIDSAVFYTQATLHKYHHFLNELLNHQLISEDISVEFGPINAIDKGHILFDKPFINRKISDDQSNFPRFLLTPISRDGHAFTIISVRNPATSKVLCTLFMNSNVSPAYFQNTAFQLEENRFYSSRLNFNELFDDPNPFSDLKIYINKTFSINLEDSTLKDSATILVNKEEKTALLVNFWKKKSGKERFDEITNDPNISIVFELDFYADWKIGIRFTTKPPIIDVSHDLQLTDKTDNNCGLYSLNFTHAIQPC